MVYIIGISIIKAFMIFGSVGVIFGVFMLEIFLEFIDVVGFRVVFVCGVVVVTVFFLVGCVLNTNFYRFGM